MKMKPECVECPYIGRSGKDECVCELPPCVKQLQTKLDSHRWIPVNEILPEESGQYLVCDFSDKRHPCFVVSFFSGDGSGLFNYTSATHWKPITLPEGDNQ